MKFWKKNTLIAIMSLYIGHDIYTDNPWPFNRLFNKIKYKTESILKWEKKTPYTIINKDFKTLELNKLQIENLSVPSERSICNMFFNLWYSDTNCLAYILATAKHETWNYKYFEEINSGKKYENRKDLWNTKKWDWEKFKWRWMIQITWRRNYTIFDELLKKEDLIWEDESILDNPEIVTRNDEIMTFILIHWMMNGLFTGKILSDYINDEKIDFINARRVVNWIDKKYLIALYSKEYIKNLWLKKHESKKITSQYIIKSWDNLFKISRKLWTNLASLEINTWKWDEWVSVNEINKDNIKVWWKVRVN